jgi:adenylylsulfate kinase
MTGLPGAGRSTIAQLIMRKLVVGGANVEILDGDELRKRPGFETGFSREERIMHLQRVAYIAHLLVRNRVFVVASFVSPYVETRDFARQFIGNFLEV